ncbi:MAG: ketol-acid reductoisomerase [candidate division Zixibacteria bacterium]|nr:ketol-acid reductoisomerase [candidate division Zixibacteria bacterium]
MAHDENVAVLGYGSQGRAIALNLRDSGFRVTVGLRPNSRSRAIARKDKIRPADLNKAAAGADIIIVALPDHRHKTVLNKKFWAAIKNKPALVFLHGSSIHFGLVTPPANLPVLLLAPHAPGGAVRENYQAKTPFSAFYAVHQGPQASGRKTILRLAKGIGIPRTHLVQTTFADEAVGDLFGEQAVLCGGLARLLKFGFETLVEAGLPPRNAYLEVAFQIDLIVALIKQYGLEGMFDRISPLAKYGSAVAGPVVIDRRVKKAMKQVLDEIVSGRFISRADKSELALKPGQMTLLTNPLFDRQARKFKKP